MTTIVMIVVFLVLIVFFHIWIAFGRLSENKGIVMLLDTILIILCLTMIVLGLKSRDNFHRNDIANISADETIDVTLETDDMFSDVPLKNSDSFEN